jgi:hypothetical protein
VLPRYGTCRTPPVNGIDSAASPRSVAREWEVSARRRRRYGGCRRVRSSINSGSVKLAGFRHNGFEALFIVSAVSHHRQPLDDNGSPALSS